MAGRPKKRAARQGVEKPPEDVPDEDFARRFTQQLLSGQLPKAADQPPTVGTPITPSSEGLAGALDIVGKADRTHLAQWWRDQMAHIEFVVQKRAQMCAAVTEHPNAIFARLALTFGAEGKPRDVAAVLLGMGEADFQLHYGHEWALGSAEVVGLASANLLRIALSSNDRYAVKAAVEVINRRGGEEWRAPAQKLEVTNPGAQNGKLIDSSKLTFDERQALKAIIERAISREAVPQLGNDGEGEE